MATKKRKDKTGESRAMRYFLNVVTENRLIQDPDGEEFADIGAATLEAEQVARALLATELAAGRKLPANWRVQVTNARAVVVKEISFCEILGSELRATPIELPARAPELIEEARAAVVQARRLRLELRENLARARAELQRGLNLARAFEYGQTLRFGAWQSQPGRDRDGGPREGVL
jgi:hypothetical protein